MAHDPATGDIPDPDGPPDPASGYFGLDDTDGRIVILPVPFEATVSYGEGTSDGPEAIRRASHQVDLADPDVGDLRDAGVSMDPSLREARSWSDAARPAARRAIAAQARGNAPDPADLAAVDEAGDRVLEAVEHAVGRILDASDRIPILLGGDHSTPRGAFRAAARRHPGLGILHVDAHADLRDRFEGFRQSHASIMRNMLADCPNTRLISVGLRDLSPAERVVLATEARIRAWLDRDLRPHRLDGRFREIARTIADALPERVWISWDIDGLDPALCPHTGTPVPGGLGWDEAIALLEAVVVSGRTIVGADLVEVSPGPGGLTGTDAWDAVVGARLLQKLAGFAVLSRRSA